MRAICIVNEPYVRDMQIFGGTVADTNKEDYMAESEEWIDVNYNSLYLGVFHGASLDEIRQKAADDTGIPKDYITAEALECSCRHAHHTE